MEATLTVIYEGKRQRTGRLITGGYTISDIRRDGAVHVTKEAMRITKGYARDKGYVCDEGGSVHGDRLCIWRRAARTEAVKWLCVQCQATLVAQQSPR